MKTLALVVLLTTLAAAAHAADPLQAFLGDFTATFEQLSHETSKWSSKTMALTGRPMLGGKYVELRGTFAFEGFERPIELVFLWSMDPFQKRVRVVVLDNLVGLLDVFEQEQASPLRVSNVPHGTYFSDAQARRISQRLTVHFLERGGIRIEGESSTDDGKTWTRTSRLTLTR